MIQYIKIDDTIMVAIQLSLFLNRRRISQFQYPWIAHISPVQNESITLLSYRREVAISSMFSDEWESKALIGIFHPIRDVSETIIHTLIPPNISHLSTQVTTRETDIESSIIATA